MRNVCFRVMAARCPFTRRGAHALAVGLTMLAAVATSGTRATAAWEGTRPIKQHNLDASRSAATEHPRSEQDQAIVNGWRLYRTDRGQESFNDAMATLRATVSSAPAASDFVGCANLHCKLSLPAIDSEGWIAPGRLWVSQKQYVLIVHSPRLKPGATYRRRSSKKMRYFVFHEFHNSTRNTDVYDTVSAHRSRVFVPFYLGKESVDAEGYRFIVLVQVAPYDVYSVHASNWGSNGPGVEVAKNMNESIEPLQEMGGIVLANIIKAEAPHLRVINHRGSEGRPLLQAYEAQQEIVKSRANVPVLVLPFVPARPDLVAAATGALADVLSIDGKASRPAYAARTAEPLEISVPAPRLLAASTIAIPSALPKIPLPELTLIAPPRLLNESETPSACADGNSSITGLLCRLGLGSRE